MKKIIATFMFLAVGLSSVAQLTPERAFTEAPAEVFPLLDRNSRLDMIDYFRSGLDTPSANRLDGHSAVTAITPESIDLRLSDASTARMVLLPAGSDTIISVVTTIALPGKDSSINFYSSDWKPLDAGNYFRKPDWTDWMVKGHKPAEVTAVVPFMLSSYELHPTTLTLTVTNSLSSFLAPEAYSDVSAVVLPSLTYRWDGHRFKSN